MSQEAEPIQLGIEMAKRAIEYDNGHKYSMAIMCYDLALDYFHKAQTAEQNEQMKTTIAAKTKEYSDRAQFLKTSLGLAESNLAREDSLNASGFPSAPSAVASVATTNGTSSSQPLPAIGQLSLTSAPSPASVPPLTPPTSASNSTTTTAASTPAASPAASPLLTPMQPPVGVDPQNAYLAQQFQLQQLQQQQLHYQQLLQQQQQQQPQAFGAAGAPVAGQPVVASAQPFQFFTPMQPAPPMNGSKSPVLAPGTPPLPPKTAQAGYVAPTYAAPVVAPTYSTTYHATYTSTTADPFGGAATRNPPIPLPPAGHAAPQLPPRPGSYIASQPSAAHASGPAPQYYGAERTTYSGPLGSIMHLKDEVSNDYVRDHFGISEPLLKKFACMRGMTSGFLYVTTTHICYDTILIGVDRKVVFKIADITKMKKKKVGHAIRFEIASGDKYTFSQFAMISKARAEAFALILRQAHAIEAPVWRDISSVEEKKATKGREKQDKKELKRREKEAKKAMKEARKRGEAPAAASADAGEWEDEELENEDRDPEIELELRRHGKSGEHGEMNSGSAVKSSPPTPTIPDSDSDLRCSYHGGKLPYKGVLHLSDTGLVFTSDFLAGKKRLEIPFSEVLSVTKARPMRKGNCIEIGVVGGTAYTFNNFWAREKAYELINSRWRSARGIRQI